MSGLLYKSRCPASSRCQGLSNPLARSASAMFPYGFSYTAQTRAAKLHYFTLGESPNMLSSYQQIKFLSLHFHMWRLVIFQLTLRAVPVHAGFYIVVGGIFCCFLFVFFFPLQNSDSHLINSFTPESNRSFALSNLKPEYKGTEKQLRTITQQRFFHVKMLRSLWRISTSWWI